MKTFPRYQIFIAAGVAALAGALIAFSVLVFMGKIPLYGVSTPSPKSFPLSVGIVNLSRVKNEAFAFQNFKTLIENRYAAFHDEIRDQELKLRKEYDTLQGNQSTEKAPTPEFLKKKEEFDKRVAEMDAIVRQRKEQLNNEFSLISAQIEDKLKMIIEKLGQTQNLNLILNATILDATVVLYGGKDIDMTDEVIQILNKEMPTISPLKETIEKEKS